MNIMDSNAAIAVQTEIKLYLTQQLHRKGYLSDEMCANATEMILTEAKVARKSDTINELHYKETTV